MQFNVTGLTEDAIIQNCESLCNLGDGGISGNTVLLKKFTGYTNQAQDKVAIAILTVDKNWRFDDTGSYGNFAVATTNLVAGQRDYVLPRATNSSDFSTLWKVYKVRIKDPNGNWFDLYPLASDANESQSTPTGKPKDYRLLGNSVRLSDIPSATAVTLTAGIQVWFQRSSVKFVYTDTTKQPAFISGFHHLLSLDASATYLLPVDSNLAAGYLTLFKNGLEDLKTHYATRNDDPKVTKIMTPFIEDTR